MVFVGGFERTKFLYSVINILKLKIKKQKKLQRINLVTFYNPIASLLFDDKT